MTADVYAPTLSAPHTARQGRAARLVRGRESDAPWVRPVLLTLLAATALLYLWGLSVSGWANSFYSAAAQAGSESWKAFFFGSSDAANAITVDKTPASLWVMSLSARLFGVSSWSLLVPEALMGVATVGLVYLSVRRWYGAAAGLLAGAAMALTPVAVMMFRFNNPDALLTLLLVGAVYAMQRAIESGGARWMVAVGTLIGFGFLTKMLQALLIVPGLALVYLVVGPTPLRRRILQLLAGGAAMIAAAGWWILIVELWPDSSRPYIGGSQNNSILELTLGYNGFGRLNGEETGSVGGGARPGGGMWGETGWLRMFNPENGGGVAWLIPAALILAAFGLWATRRAPRTDLLRAGLLLWGSWFLITMAVFSFMKGIYHPYYTVALAPAVGATVGIGAALAWRERRTPAGGVALSAALAVTVWWAYRLLERSPQFQSWLGPTVLVLGLLATFALLLNTLLPGRIAAILAVAAIVIGLAGPAAYAVETAGNAHTGGIPSAGPQIQGARGGPGGFGGASGRGGDGAGGFGGQRMRNAMPNGALPQGFPGGSQVPGGQLPGQSGGQMSSSGGAGGLLNASTPGVTLTAMLKEGADNYTWVAAAVGSNSASGFQLASGKPVMSVGGFNGSDPAPTLEQFQQYVAEGRIHYFLGGGGPGGGGGANGNVMGGSQNGGSRASAEISTWVAATFTAQTVDGVTVYDLTAPTASDAAAGTLSGVEA